MTEDEVRAVHERIRVAITSAGLSERKVAAKMGVSSPYFSKMRENLSEPTLGNLHDICQITGVTVDWLFYGNPPMRANEAAEEDSPEMVALLRSPFGRTLAASTVAGLRAIAGKSNERLSEEELLALARAIEGQKALVGRVVTSDPVEDRKKARKR